ncbi:hypothetical protein FRC18_011541 [Serendipita sp. 400]|nr:hypothetical protein FRC18_011541 [Serendipita sp. 400]
MSLPLIGSHPPTPTPERFPDYDHSVADDATDETTSQLFSSTFDPQYLKLWNDIVNQEANLALLPDNSPEKPDHFFVLARLYGRISRAGGSFGLIDLKNAIENQKAGLKLLSDDSPQKPNRLFELARLCKRCADRDPFGWPFYPGRTPNLDNAIANQKAGLELLSDCDPQKPTQLSYLAELYEECASVGPSDRLRDIKNAIASHEAALKLLPDSDPTKPSHFSGLVRTRAILNKHTEEVKQSLLTDLKELAKHTRRAKSSFYVPFSLMENVIKLLDDSDVDKLCDDICSHSIRLSAYCEALRSQVGRGTDLDDLQALYEEIVATERRISVAHRNLTERHEKIYTIWRAKREQISNMLSLLDSVDSQDYTKGIRTRIQQVDEGFEKIRRVLEDQGRALKDYIDTYKTLLVSSNRSQGYPLLGPVAPDNPENVIQPPDPVDLPKAVEVGKERLSQVGAVVGKARYTKSRYRVEEKLSATARQLEELHSGSKEYESEIQGLAVSQPQPLRQLPWWNRWSSGPSHQLPNLVKSMTNKLKEIQGGFDKYKESILGLIFRPLGDMIEDLKPHFSQVGKEIIGQGLHPDMLLYEAAFLFLRKNVSMQCNLTEQISIPPPLT